LPTVHGLISYRLVIKDSSEVMKCETVHKLPMFKDAYRRRRCILPVDGFYEWRAIKGQRAKQPYAIAMKDDRPFGIGGLWENWKNRRQGNGFARLSLSRLMQTNLSPGDRSMGIAQTHRLPTQAPIYSDSEKRSFYRCRYSPLPDLGSQIFAFFTRHSTRISDTTRTSRDVADANRRFPVYSNRWMC
jgi:hypothetical protein